MPKNNGSWDFLDVLTKKDIIEFLKNSPWIREPPSKKDVAFWKYQNHFKDYQKKIAALDQVDLTDTAEKADTLTVLINQETDINKKIQLLKEREIYVNQIREHHKKLHELHKKEEKFYQWYKNIEEEE
jgi:hypothetical protein